MRVKRGDLDVVDETVVLAVEGLLLSLDPEVLVDGEVLELRVSACSYAKNGSMRSSDKVNRRGITRHWRDV